MERHAIVQDIYRALERANALRESDAALVCAEDTLLYGPEGALDSLGLVSLIMDVEEAINSRTGAAVVLADGRAMAQRHNPFRDVRSLADYALARLREAQA
jgi:hypothetical protein